ncbi:hypothetical protein FPQ18DRAFT_412871 [Pyronema domesticum]|nr:hypothetical protein FPQ18DRAFT_412871 [Pyronema domesticum]
MKILRTFVLAVAWSATTLAFPIPFLTSPVSDIPHIVSEGNEHVDGNEGYVGYVGGYFDTPAKHPVIEDFYSPGPNLLLPPHLPQDTERPPYSGPPIAPSYDDFSSPIPEIIISPPSADLPQYGPYTPPSPPLTPPPSPPPSPIYDLLPPGPPQHGYIERPPYSGPPIAPDYDDFFAGGPEIIISAPYDTRDFLAPYTPPSPPLTPPSPVHDALPLSRIHKRQADNYGFSGWNAGYAVEFPSWGEAFGELTSAVGGVYDSARSWWKGDAAAASYDATSYETIGAGVGETVPAAPEMVTSTQQASDGLWASVKNLWQGDSSSTVSAPSTGLWDNVKSWWQGVSAPAPEVLDMEKVTDEPDNKGNAWSWLEGARGLWRSDFEGVDRTEVVMPEIDVPVINVEVPDLEGSINEAMGEMPEMPGMPEIPEIAIPEVPLQENPLPEIAAPEVSLPKPEPPLPSIATLPSIAPPSKSALKPWIRNSYQLSSNAGPLNDEEISAANTEAKHNGIANVMTSHLAEPKSVRFGYITSLEADPMTFGQWDYDERGHSDSYDRNEGNGRAYWDTTGDEDDAGSILSQDSDEDINQDLEYDPPAWILGENEDTVRVHESAEPTPEVAFIVDKDGHPQWTGDPGLQEAVEWQIELEGLAPWVGFANEVEDPDEGESIIGEDEDLATLVVVAGEHDEAGVWHPTLNDISMASLSNFVDEDTLAMLNNIEDPHPVVVEDNEINLSVPTGSVGGEEPLPVVADNNDIPVLEPSILNDLNKSLPTVEDNASDTPAPPGSFGEESPLDVVDDTELAALYQPLLEDHSMESLPAVVDDVNLNAALPPGSIVGEEPPPAEMEENSLPAAIPPPVVPDINEGYTSHGGNLYTAPVSTDKSLPAFVGHGFLPLSGKSAHPTTSPTTVKYAWKPKDTLPDNDDSFDRNTIYSFESSGSDKSSDSLGLSYDAWMNYESESPVSSSDSSVYSLDSTHLRPHPSDDELPDSSYESDAFSDDGGIWSDEEVWTPQKPFPRDDELPDDYDPYDESGRLKQPGWGDRYHAYLFGGNGFLDLPADDELSDDYDPYDESGRLKQPDQAYRSFGNNGFLPLLAPADDELPDDYDPYDESGRLKKPVWADRSFVDNEFLPHLPPNADDELGDDYDPYDESGKLVRPWRDNGPHREVYIVPAQGGHGELLASGEDFIWPEDDDSHAPKLHHPKATSNSNSKYRPSPGRYNSMDLDINPPSLKDYLKSEERARRQAAAEGRRFKDKHNYIYPNDILRDSYPGYSDEKWNIPVFGYEEDGLLTNSKLDRFNRIEKPRGRREGRVWKREITWERSASIDDVDSNEFPGYYESFPEFPEFPDEYPPYLRPGAPAGCGICESLSSLSELSQDSGLESGVWDDASLIHSTDSEDHGFDIYLSIN